MPKSFAFDDGQKGSVIGFEIELLPKTIVFCKILLKYITVPTPPRFRIKKIILKQLIMIIFFETIILLSVHSL